MHRAVRTSAILLAAAGLVASGTTAVAHEDHGGLWEPSPESQTQNLKIIGSLPRTSEVPSYRNSDLAFWGRTAYAGNYDGFRILDRNFRCSTGELDLVASDGSVVAFVSSAPNLEDSTLELRPAQD